MTKDIQEKPCIVNSDIGETSSEFGIAHGSRGSRRTFNHSRSKSTVLQRIMSYVTYTKWTLATTNQEEELGTANSGKARSHAHFCQQDVGSTHPHLRMYFRRDFLL